VVRSGLGIGHADTLVPQNRLDRQACTDKL
jgi:hypothetical protein